MLNRFFFMLTLAGSAALTTGCHRYYFADSVDLDLDFTPPLDPDRLHSPYVIGTRVSIGAHREGKGDESGYRVVSETPAVLACEAGSTPNVSSCTAVAAGTATLALLDDDGDVKRREHIDVRIPTRAEVYAHGPLILGEPEASARVESFQALSGGTATFLVRYFDDDQELGGNGVLATSTSDGLDANVARSFLFESRDWLQLTPTSVGLHSVALEVGGHTVARLGVEGVDDRAVADVEIRTDVRPSTEDGAQRTLYAEAFDATGEVIYGVAFDWMLDGESEPGAGDLYRYTHRAGRTHQVAAIFGELSASGTIETDGGYVRSTNDVGCAIASSQAGPSGLTVGMLVACALLVRRRALRTAAKSRRPSRRRPLL